jgi:hypothetical protein
MSSTDSLVQNWTYYHEGTHELAIALNGKLPSPLKSIVYRYYYDADFKEALCHGVSTILEQDGIVEWTISMMPTITSPNQVQPLYVHTYFRSTFENQPCRPKSEPWHICYAYIVGDILNIFPEHRSKRGEKEQIRAALYNAVVLTRDAHLSAIKS